MAHDTCTYTKLQYKNVTQQYKYITSKKIKVYVYYLIIQDETVTKQMNEKYFHLKNENKFSM